LAGGLEDSNVEAVNPFPLPSELKHPCTLMEDELTKGAQTATRDLARWNKASTFSDFFIKFSDMNSQLVLIATGDKEEEYVPPPAVRKVAAKIRPPV